MYLTMDRYEADWAMVKRGWDVYVNGVADLEFESIDEAMKHLREVDGRIDQMLPLYNQKGAKPVSTISDAGFSNILFNFRGG